MTTKTFKAFGRAWLSDEGHNGHLPYTNAKVTAYRGVLRFNAHDVGQRVFLPEPLGYGVYEGGFRLRVGQDPYESIGPWLHDAATGREISIEHCRWGDENAVNAWIISDFRSYGKPDPRTYLDRAFITHRFRIELMPTVAHVRIEGQRGSGRWEVVAQRSIFEEYPDTMVFKFGCYWPGLRPSFPDARDRGTGPAELTWFTFEGWK